LSAIKEKNNNQFCRRLFDFSFEMASHARFAETPSVSEFIEQQENNNTRLKTLRDITLLQEFLSSKNELRRIEEISVEQLNEYLSEFIISVRKKQDNGEYEPSSLRSMFASFERYLKKKNGLSIMMDTGFERARKALQSKQKELKQKGKGNKPNACVALSEDEVKLLYEKELLGISSREALLNTVWFNNTIHFGLRGCKEHRDMCWGDVKLRKNANGNEYLEYFERQTKTRTGENPRDVRKVTPKMYAIPTNPPEKDPVFVYKVYAEKRPNEVNTDEAPFYLAVNHCKRVSSDKSWFKKNALGVNKLNSLMKTMAEKAGLGPNISNHSGRKTMMQTLTNNDIPPTDIVQLSGHKNLQSVTNYSTVTQNQQKRMSQALANLATGEKSSSESSTCTSSIKSTPEIEQQQQQQQHAMALFSGAVIQGGQISISINTLNQSPVAVTENVSPQQYKRIRLIDSDSD
jgi:site-specific recombinase XerD